MSHTYVHNPVHIVFSTKERRKLVPKESKPRLRAYMAGVCAIESSGDCSVVRANDGDPKAPPRLLPEGGRASPPREGSDASDPSQRHSLRTAA